MIAKYRGQFFNISLVKQPTRIWRYDYIEGFQKKEKPDGLLVYEKIIDITEVDEIFEVGFSVKWHGEQLGASLLSNNRVQLVTNNRSFANQFIMEEFERGVFWTSVKIEECTDFRMKKDYYLSKSFETIQITADEFKSLYVELRQNLIPKQN